EDSQRTTGDIRVWTSTLTPTSNRDVKHAVTIDSTTITVVAILFLATFIRSAFGFGEALVAVPLLALIMPVEVAAPVAVVVSITVAAIVVAQDWRHVHFRSAGWLVLASLVGT